MFEFFDGAWFLDGQPIPDHLADALDGYTSFEGGKFVGAGLPSVTLPILQQQAQLAIQGQEAPFVGPPEAPEQIEGVGETSTGFKDMPWVDPFTTQTKMIPYRADVNGWVVTTFAGELRVIHPDDQGNPSLEEQVAAAVGEGNLEQAAQIKTVEAQLDLIRQNILGKEFKTFDEAVLSSLENATDLEGLDKAAFLQNFQSQLSPAAVAQIERDVARETQAFEFEKEQATLDRAESNQDFLLRQEKFQFEQEEAARARQLEIARSPADVFSASFAAGGGFQPPTEGGVRRIGNQFLEGGETEQETAQPIVSAPPPQQDPVARPSESQARLSGKFQDLLNDLAAEGITGQDALDFAKEFFGRSKGLGGDSVQPAGNAREGQGAQGTSTGGASAFTDPQFASSLPIEGGGQVPIPERLKSTVQGKIVSPSQSQSRARGIAAPTPQQLRNLSASERAGLGGFAQSLGISPEDFAQDIRRTAPAASRRGSSRITTAGRR